MRSDLAEQGAVRQPALLHGASDGREGRQAAIRFYVCNVRSAVRIQPVSVRLTLLRPKVCGIVNLSDDEKMLWTDRSVSVGVMWVGT